MSITGNKKRLLDEWEKVRDESEEVYKNSDPYTMKGGANPEAVKAQDKVWKKGNDLTPLMDDLGKQEEEEEKRKQSRFSALQKMMRGE